ncbi:hypothetical protein [Pseudomonas sp.]|uniref:hypothetical protein n=1 Tax=Pseudomonas sp. TaxID=306 RepID=UPI00286AD5A4|nr:hypothetical protein [Pseudomonas sp.]
MGTVSDSCNSEFDVAMISPELLDALTSQDGDFEKLWWLYCEFAPLLALFRAAIGTNPV